DAELVRERLGDLAQMSARPHFLDELGVDPTKVIRLLAALTLLQQVGQVLHWPLPVRRVCRGATIGAGLRRAIPAFCESTTLSGSRPSSRVADRARTHRRAARTCRATRPIRRPHCSTWRSSTSRGASSHAYAFRDRE